MSIHGPILRRLLSRPAAIAAIDDRKPWKSAELLLVAFRLAEEIDRRSKAPHVGVMLPTSGVFPAAALACWILGRTVVPLNYLLKDEELRYVIRDAGLDLIVTVQALLDAVDAKLDPAAQEPSVAGARLLRLEDLDFRAVPEPRWPANSEDDDLAVLLYTSGTSGRPKGVMLTHGNVAANIRQCIQHVHFDRSFVVMGVLPQFHSFGLTVLTLLPLTVGARVIYTARFIPAKLVRLIREHRPTCFVALPSMYNALLSVKDATAEDFASLVYTVSGGEPLPDAVLDRFRERFGVTINEGYGLSETAPVTNWCRPHEFRPHSVGPAVPGIEQIIVGEAGGRRAVLPPGQEGEIRMKGPNVMRGYYKLPVETAAAFDDHGYFKTGDMGRLSDDGHLSITGRIKEMIIVGGENVFPREIEEVLARHPAVKACGVIGVPDGLRGELPVAFVEVNEGKAFDEKDLRTWCRDRLAGYKAPRRVFESQGMPRTPTGKVLRRALKDLVPPGLFD